MSMNADTIARLVALCERIQLPSPLGPSHAYETEEECSFADEDLPAFVISDVPDETYRQIDDGTYQTSEEFYILVYVSSICDESYKKNVAAWQLVKDCREVIADFFYQRRSLAYDDAGLVDSALLTRGRIMTLATKGVTTKYHGLVFRMTTTFTKFVNQFDDIE